MLPREERFLCDCMLGKLAVYLRMCGYDTIYAGDLDIEDDAAIRTVAEEQDRQLVTRDQALAEATEGAILLASRAIEDQLAAMREAGLTIELPERPRRCGRCNGVLDEAPDDEPRPEYAPADPTVECFCCRSCGQYFWRGSHWDAVADVLDNP